MREVDAAAARRPGRPRALSYNGPPMGAPQVLGFLFAGASTVVAFATLLLVAWQAPGHRANQLMAVYLLCVTVWGVTNFVARFLSVVGGDPVPWGYAATAATGLSGFALFWAVTYFAGIERRPWVRAARAAGVVWALVCVPALYAGRLMENLTITPDGLFRYRLSPAGAVAFLGGTTILLMALGCIWTYRRRGTGPLLPGGAALAAGTLLTYAFIALGVGVPPVTIAGAAVASVCFTYAILRENLFNPLARSQASLSALIENTGDPAWSVDGALRLTAFNAAFAALLQRVYGVTPALGRHVLDALPSDVRLLWARFYERALRGERFTVERHFTVPGVPADVELAFNPIVSADGVVGVAAVARDVTVHKRSLAGEARAREAAEAASHAKSRFLANLAAELRAPIETLLATLRTELPGAVQEAARRLRGLIDDVRELSELEAGRADLAELPFALRRHLAAVVQPLAAAAAGTGRHLAVVVDEDVPDALVGDPRRLRQVVAGVLADAVTRGERTDVVLRVTRDAEMFGAVRLRLELDGVAPGMMDRLGFALAARLAEAMGGAVVVDGDGARPCRVAFTLRLGVE
jgi:PAS domain S-box-containing protein